MSTTRVTIAEPATLIAAHPTIVAQQRSSGLLPGGTCSAAATTTMTPADLARPVPVDIAIIDVDNLVIGRGGRIDPARAMDSLDEVYHQLSQVELSLAVMSASTHRVIGRAPWFRFGNWTWRVAEIGADAADHQLLEFARTMVAQRPGARVAIASGDGIFAQLQTVADIEVVVPQEHHGVAGVLRPWLRVRGAQASAARYGLAA